MTQEQVQGFISQYLTQQTRHAFENLKIKDFKSFDCELEVEVAHTIHIEAIEDTSKEPEGELLTKGDYENMIKAIKRDESANPDWINKLQTHIQECGYGDYYTQERYIKSLSSWFLCGLPQCFSYQKPCHKCGGKGSVTCDDCKGKGQVKCSSCSGKGKVKRTKYEKGKSKTYFEECSTCRGYGNVDCRKCNSSGIVDCSSCYTTGTITTNAEFVACVDTKYHIKVASENPAFDLSKILKDIPNDKLASHGECERLELAQSEQGVKERYKITLPVAQCTIELDSKPFVWNLYGREIQLASDDHCASYILQADVENLQKTARLCYLKPFILWQAKKPIKNFMDSPINKRNVLGVSEELLETLKKCKKDEQLREVMISSFKEQNIVISFEHLSNSVFSLLSLTGAYFFFSRVFWFVVAVVLGIVCFEYTEQIQGWVASVWTGAPYVHYFVLAPSLALVFGYIWRILMVNAVWDKDLMQWLDKIGKAKRGALDVSIGFFGLAWIVLQVVWHYIMN